MFAKELMGSFVAFVTINLQISKYFVTSCYCNSLFWCVLYFLIS